MKNENEKNDAKQDLLIIDAETGLLSHPSTLECVFPNSGILFPNLFGASSERITLYNERRERFRRIVAQWEDIIKTALY